MDSRNLNQLLFQTFPELTPAYLDEVSWQDGDDTGSHVVFGDVVNPILRRLMETQDFTAAQPYFDFTERLLESSDDYAGGVATVTLLEGLFYGPGDRSQIEKHLGPFSRKVWRDYEAHAKAAAAAAKD